MPVPNTGESRNDFVSRCIPIVLDDGTAKDNDQAVAICNSMWEEREKEMTPQEIMLKSIRERQQKKTEFAYGIVTADKYVKTLLDVVGLEACYKYGCKGNLSFDDSLQKAMTTLVYSNEDMADVEQKAVKDQYNSLPSGMELPKNCLMVFRHKLTTPRKDRDGDILRTEGMRVDPKMLLLWQHVHTMPIGKYLMTATHNSKVLDIWSCIVDMNETSHDAAVMVDNGMGRFSHGFRAIEFDQVKASDGTEAGFDVKEAEIMEESLVSVPANIDAETEEILLSLVEGGKLTSPVMKKVGQSLREKTPTSVPVKLDLKVTVNGKEVDDENERGNRDETAGGKGITSSKETDDKHEEKESDKEDKTEDKEVTVCPKCGSKDIVDGVCQDCGYKMTDEKPREEVEGEEGEEGEEEKQSDTIDEKSGRILSKSNESRLRESREYMEEAYNMDVPKPCKACIGHARKTLDDVLGSLGAETRPGEISVKDAMVKFLVDADSYDRKKLLTILSQLEDIDERDKRTKQFRAIRKTH